MGTMWISKLWHGWKTRKMGAMAKRGYYAGVHADRRRKYGKVT